MLRAQFVIAALFVLAATSLAQQAEPSSTASCNLDDGRQVYIRYNAVTAKNDKLSNGKPWTPGGMPMTLFTEAQLTFGGSTIPVGAYTVYPIPAKDKWTLAVNKNVTPAPPTMRSRTSPALPSKPIKSASLPIRSRSPSPTSAKNAPSASTSAKAHPSLPSPRGSYFADLVVEDLEKADCHPERSEGLMYLAAATAARPAIAFRRQRS
jgi:hypothetical protein